MRFPLSIALILAAANAFAQPGKIHPDPSKPLKGFKPHQLSFELPKDEIARDEFRSEPFFAVILRTLERCSAKQAELDAIQKLFPANKVFAPLTDCDDPAEDTIFYTNVNPKVGFIAVYAGPTQEHAQRFFATVKETGKFPGANLRRMQAVLGYP